MTGLCSFGHKSGPRRGEKNESWGLARTHARPARPHSTCYSMAGSTWSKNTNFHAFMASKKSLNFQIIFNITCLYWAARSSQRVSSKCQIGIGKPIGTDTVHWIDSWERLRDSCLMFTKDHEMKIRKMFQLMEPGLKRRGVGPCWCKLVASLKRIFVSKPEDIIYCMQTQLRSLKTPVKISGCLGNGKNK